MLTGFEGNSSFCLTRGSETKYFFTRPKAEGNSTWSHSRGSKDRTVALKTTIFCYAEDVVAPDQHLCQMSHEK